MRKSLAPSQRAAAPSTPSAPLPSTIQSKPVVPAKVHAPPPSSAPKQGAGVGTSSFTILWAKASGKKHKTWDEGVLQVKENLSCVILNGEGKEIGKSRLSAKEIAGLSPGTKFTASSYEIEIVSVGAAPPIVVAKPAPSSISTPSSAAPASTETKYFAVYWCTASAKKHKAMDTGFMIVTPPDGSCVLKDSRGTELGTTKSKKALEDASCVTRISGYEVQIEKQIKASEMVFDTDVAAPVVATTTVKAATVPFKPHAPLTAKKHTPLFSPNDPDAFVLHNPTEGVAVVLDPLLKRKLHEHQLEGVKFLYECVMGLRNPSITGCILADEMGLGKTLQAIALLWTLLKQGPQGVAVVQKAIVVTPSSLVGNWAKEMRKWCDIRPLYATIATDRKSASVATGSIQDCIRRFANSPIAPVLLVSYEQFRMYSDELTPLRCDLMICDEGHRIKNSSSQIATALNSMTSPRRVILSGTPLQNDLDEFYCMFNFVAPGLLGPSQTFKAQYSSPIIASRDPKAPPAVKEAGQRESAALTALTAPFMLRRTAALMEHYMPPKQEFVLFCKLTQEQQQMYEHLLKSKALGSLFSAIDGGGGVALQFVLYLKKLSNHPRLLHECEELQGLPSALRDLIAQPTINPDHSGKMKLVSDLLRLIRSTTTDRVVLVSNYTQTLDLLAAICTQSNYPFLRIDGSIDGKRRTQIVEAFNSPHRDTFVLLLSARAGGVGLNLIGANRLVLFDPDWNPATDRQAMARVWREGQRKPVYIYRLLSTGTIDEKIYQRQLSKEALGNAILQDEEGGEDVSAFSRDELRDIFSLNDATMSDTHDLLQCTCLGGADKKQKKSGGRALSKRAAAEIGRMTHHSDLQDLDDAILRQLNEEAGVTLVMCRKAKQDEEDEEQEEMEEKGLIGNEDVVMEEKNVKEEDKGEEEEEEEEEEGSSNKINTKRRRVVAIEDDDENE